jgi:hypothetical protein
MLGIPMNRVGRTLVLASILGAALTGCRTGPSARPVHTGDLLTEQEHHRARAGCVVAQAPDALPPADVVVDSSQLVDALERYRADHAERDGYAVLSIAFDRNGYNVRRQIIEHNLPHRMADTLQKLVFEHRRSVAEGDPWGVRLRIDVGDPISLRLGRQVLCAPRPRQLPPGIFTMDGIERWDVQRQDPGVTLPSTSMHVRVLIDEAGRVVDAEPLMGLLDVRAQNELYVALRGAVFEPALEDGIPVPGTMTLRIRGRRTR